MPPFLMIAVMMQAAIPMAEPILVGGLVTGGGVGLLWFARKILSTSERVQDIHLMLFGHPNDPSPDKGWASRVDQIGERVNTLEWHMKMSGCPGASSRHTHEDHHGTP